MFTPRLRQRAVGPGLTAGAVAGSLVAGIGIGYQPKVVLAVAGLLGLLAITKLVVRSPDRAYVVSLAALVVVPFSGLPFYGLVDPGLVGMAVLAVASFSGVAWPRQPKITFVDIAVGTIFFGLFISFLAGHEPINRLLAYGLTWGIPFVIGRPKQSIVVEMFIF